MRFASKARNSGRNPGTRSSPRAAFAFVFAGALAIFAFAASRSARTVEADEWQPISQDELKMTSVPEAPGAPAVILFRQVDRDDNAKTGNQQEYVRIKILTEEGRKYADVEIPYFREQGNIVALRARTIRPDGSVAMFEGKAYDKTIVKARNVKYLAKTFTLPDVQVGSIIEYRYTEDMAENYVYNSLWILSDELFTKHAKFSLRPNKDFALRWSWPVGLPAGTQPPKEEPTPEKPSVWDFPPEKPHFDLPRLDATERSQSSAPAASKAKPAAKQPAASDAAQAQPSQSQQAALTPQNAQSPTQAHCAS